ncbi:hypothetical protein D068_cds01990 [Bacillus atrophaeus UCMB-5137]|nr:hypothetical protein D068_cds01990 [Bacillus atrophaeus UCMB-5137]
MKAISFELFILSSEGVYLKKTIVFSREIYYDEKRKLEIL